MIGDTALFEPAQRSIYQNVGAGHLLAVSGLQVTLFALILYFLFLRLPLLWRCSPATGWQYGFWITLILIMIWTYVALCAWPPSAIRAAMMTTHYLLAATWGRPQSLSHILCTSGSLALLWQPSQIIDPSFLLSYAALFGLLIFTAKASAVHPALGLLRTWTLGSLGSTLATFPFVAHFFGVFIPAGFVVNIFLIPVASFIQVPSLFLAGLGVAFSVPAFCHWGAAIAGLLEAICDCWCHWLPEPTPCPSLSWLQIYLCCVCFFLFAKWKAIKARASLALSLMIVLALAEFGLPQTSLKIDILPVGHGDATFITFTNGQNMLIDGGGNPLNAEDPTPRGLRSYLARKNIKAIDVVVVSHPDPDHLLGLLEVVDKTTVGEIWHSGFGSEHTLMKRLLQLAKKKKVPVKTGNQLIAVKNFGQTKIEILFPKPTPKRVAIFPEFGPNDNSLVMLFSHQGKRLLWPGDLEFFGEYTLLQHYPSLKVDLLKAPHHGSTTSSSPAFVAATKPDHVVFTVPKRSRFGFPKEEIQERWRKAGAQLWSTGQHGMIGIKIHRSGIEITPTRTLFASD